MLVSEQVCTAPAPHMLHLPLDWRDHIELLAVLRHPHQVAAYRAEHVLCLYTLALAVFARSPGVSCGQRAVTFCWRSMGAGQWWSRLHMMFAWL